MRKFWDGICKEAISGSISKFVPSLEFWAPFIGENSRSGDFVYNTEYLKGAQDNDEQEFLECLSEETLESILDTDLSTLRELCANCGIDAGKLTKVNCIVKLKWASTAKVKIDNFFF